MPDSLRVWLRGIPEREAQRVWDWLQSNSNTVITDELEKAIRARRGWKED